MMRLLQWARKLPLLSRHKISHFKKVKQKNSLQEKNQAMQRLINSNLILGTNSAKLQVA